MVFFIKIHGTATVGTADLWPRGNVGKAGFGKNFGTLTDNYFLGLMDAGRQAGKSIGEGILRVKQRFHFNVGVF